MKRTIENLAKALIGESQARNRYTYYAKTAQKEGFEKLSEIFLITADNEREHAKWLLKLINELQEKSGEKAEAIKVEAEAPTTLSTTVENLKAAISGENFEYTQMYPEFARVAGEEGLPDISKRLLSIAKAEAHHEERYKKILAEVSGGTFFKKAEQASWICRKCGYEHTGNEPPEKCPACDHPPAYYELKCECF